MSQHLLSWVVLAVIHLTNNRISTPLAVYLHWFLQLYRTADAILVFGGDLCAVWELWRQHSAGGFESKGLLPDWCGSKSNKGIVWETWKLCPGFDKRLEVTTRGIPYSYAGFRLLSQKLQQWNIQTKDGNVHLARLWTKNWQNTARSVAVTGNSAAHKMPFGHGALPRTVGLPDRGAAVPGEGPDPATVQDRRQDRKPTKEAKEMAERVRKGNLHPLPIPPICWLNLLERHGPWWISSSSSRIRVLGWQHLSPNQQIKRPKTWSVLWRKPSQSLLLCLRSFARHTRERNRLGFGKSRKICMQQRLHLAVLAKHTRKQRVQEASQARLDETLARKPQSLGVPVGQLQSQHGQIARCRSKSLARSIFGQKDDLAAQHQDRSRTLLEDLTAPSQDKEEEKLRTQLQDTMTACLATVGVKKEDIQEISDEDGKEGETKKRQRPAEHGSSWFMAGQTLVWRKVLPSRPKQSTSSALRPIPMKGTLVMQQALLVDQFWVQKRHGFSDTPWPMKWTSWTLAKQPTGHFVWEVICFWVQLILIIATLLKSLTPMSLTSGVALRGRQDHSHWVIQLRFWKTLTLLGWCRSLKHQRFEIYAASNYLCSDSRSLRNRMSKGLSGTTVGSRYFMIAAAKIPFLKQAIRQNWPEFQDAEGHIYFVHPQPQDTLRPSWRTCIHIIVEFFSEDEAGNIGVVPALKESVIWDAFGNANAKHEACYYASQLHFGDVSTKFEHLCVRAKYRHHKGGRVQIASRRNYNHCCRGLYTTTCSPASLSTFEWIRGLLLAWTPIPGSHSQPSRTLGDAGSDMEFPSPHWRWLPRSAWLQSQQFRIPVWWSGCNGYVPPVAGADPRCIGFHWAHPYWWPLHLALPWISSWQWTFSWIGMERCQSGSFDLSTLATECRLCTGFSTSACHWRCTTGSFHFGCHIGGLSLPSTWQIQASSG